MLSVEAILRQKQAVSQSVGKMDSKSLLANIVKNGNKILLAGGGLRKFGEAYTSHPNIIIWDDEQQDMNGRKVPGSVKAILYNRYISHTTAHILNNAVHSLGAFKFPMLRSAEIRELLSEIIPCKGGTTLEELSDIIQEQPKDTEAQAPTPSEQEESKPMVAKQAGKGQLQDFLAKKLNINIDYSVKGSISKEGSRLFAIAKADGIKTTLASVNQGVGKMVRTLKASKDRPTSISSHKTSSNDDFAELDKLLLDAVAAMKLIQEHLPKVRREVEKLRSSREKMLKLLE